tara:strand:+ start:631 stop:960 length:330 start_codon:yes stop_codon:yes gene_type:complete
MTIDDCVNRPLLTAEVIGMALTKRINELMNGSVTWLEGVTDDRRMSEAEELGHSAFWVIISELQEWRNRIDDDLEEMYDEQSKVFQDRVESQSIPTEFGLDRGFPSYEM